jgi:hypothetical protein
VDDDDDGEGDENVEGSGEDMAGGWQVRTRLVMTVEGKEASEGSEGVFDVFSATVQMKSMDELTIYLGPCSLRLRPVELQSDKEGRET